MNNLPYKDLDPFDHGTTTILYKYVPDSVFDDLGKVLGKGWGLGHIEKIEQIQTATERASSNFRIRLSSAETKEVLLKKIQNGDPSQQDLVNRCLAYCRDNGVSLPYLIPTRKNASFFADNGHIYCLYNFIDGEHFDGSREELINTAIQLPNFHSALLNLPYLGEFGSTATELKQGNRIVIKHDRKRFEDLVGLVKSHPLESEFDAYARKHIQELNVTSIMVSASNIDTLPQQATHGEIHPLNLIYDRNSKELRAFLDLGSIVLSQRIRDVAYAMHRLARTYGEKTERKNDSGTDMKYRAGLFLQKYDESLRLTDEEIVAVPRILQDKALIKIMAILRNHYQGDETWAFDLEKQLTTLREASNFSF